MSTFPFASMRRRFDLRCYFVVGPDDTKGRPVDQVVAAALRGGVSFIQLRAKQTDARDITLMARDIAAMIAEAGASDSVAFVIDDRVDAAWQCRRMGIKVDGVHIGQDDMDPAAARALLGDDAIIGLSVETVAHVEAANALADGTIDYLGAGPLHFTATKPDAASVEQDGTKHALGVAGAAALCAASRYPVVVGGGVHEADVHALAQSPADGWFVVSAIAAADDPQAATHALVDAWYGERGDRRHGYADTDGTVHAGNTTSTDDVQASVEQSAVASSVAGSSRTSTSTMQPKQPHGLPAVLTIAGSDSSGGAGIQADLKTMLANGVFGMSAITSLTAQNTTGVRSAQNADPAILADQIDAVFEDIPPLAVKIGMVSSVELIETIAGRLTAHQACNIVLDPVMVATSGAKLIDDDAVAALTMRLFPLARVITPNIPETEALLTQMLEERSQDTAAPVTGEDAGDGDVDDIAVITGIVAHGIRTQDDMEQAGRMLAAYVGCAVLVKGGHGVKDANDVLVEPDGAVTWFPGRHIDNPNTHGTGCTLSSAIAAHLALGRSLPEAVRAAKEYLTGALAEQLDLGHGAGPMDHGWRWR